VNTKLESLFPVEPLPKPGGIVVPFPGDPERDSLYRALASRPWTSITYSHLTKAFEGILPDAFIDLSIEGRAYFLPAFLRICIEHPEEANTLPDVLISVFAEDGIERDQLVARLTSPQRSFLLSFFDERFSHRTSVNLARAREVLNPTRQL
jgi:hypothetical protein